MYVKKQGKTDVLIASLYVDDFIFTESQSKMVEEFKKEMMKKYGMSDLGLLYYFLGIEIYQIEEEVFIYQRK